MAYYIGKRLLQLIPVMVGISIILFSIMNLTPGDPAELLLGNGATPEQIEALHEELGLNEPFLVRYVTYMKNILLHGDFGTSYKTKQPVFDIVFARFPNTLRIAGIAIGLSVIMGLGIGVFQAVHQYSRSDNAISLFTLVFTAFPDFWFGLILIIFFAVKLDILPASGNATYAHFILPGITASVGYTAGVVRLTRSSMLEVIRSDYVRTAWAKGCNERLVTYHHALKNALLPVVTLIGINLGWQLGGTIIIEQIFSIPGIGTLMINAVRTKDTPLLMASVMFIALLASVINLITDITYAYIDPRVKSKYMRVKKGGKS